VNNQPGTEIFTGDLNNYIHGALSRAFDLGLEVDKVTNFHWFLKVYVIYKFGDRIPPGIAYRQGVPNLIHPFHNLPAMHLASKVDIVGFSQKCHFQGIILHRVPSRNKWRIKDKIKILVSNPTPMI
jgi:hypothetical protein